MRRTENNTDELLLARVTDAARLCAKRTKPCFVGFLDERQAAVASAAISRDHEVQAHLFGGYEGALRVVLGIFPWKICPEEDFFPVVPITVRYRPRDTLTHRDFLGTLMAQGIRRDCVGDILVGEGSAVLFLLKEIVPFVLGQMEKVGGVGVQLIEGLPDGLPEGKGTKELTDTIASPRLDAVVASVCRVSREEAARRIAAGLVAVNHLPVTAVSGTVKEGDTLSVRGSGRFRVTQVGPPTKKGRLRLKAEQYL